MKEDIIVYILCDVALTGIVVFLLQQLVLYRINKKLKIFESKLDATKSKDVVRYEKLFSEALPKINKLNSLINEENVICSEAIIRGDQYVYYKDKQSKDKYDEVAARLIKKHNEIHMYLREHSTFLPNDLVESFRNMCDTLGFALNDMLDDDPEIVKRNHVLFYERLHNASKDLEDRLKRLLSIDMNDPWEINN